MGLTACAAAESFKFKEKGEGVGAADRPPPSAGAVHGQLGGFREGGGGDTYVRALGATAGVAQGIRTEMHQSWGGEEAKKSGVRCKKSWTECRPSVLFFSYRGGERERRICEHRRWEEIFHSRYVLAI